MTIFVPARSTKLDTYKELQKLRRSCDSKVLQNVVPIAPESYCIEVKSKIAHFFSH